jgi:hypothetical protein
MFLKQWLIMKNDHYRDAARGTSSDGITFLNVAKRLVAPATLRQAV